MLDLAQNSPPRVKIPTLTIIMQKTKHIDLYIFEDPAPKKKVTHLVYYKYQQRSSQRWVLTRNFVELASEYIFLYILSKQWSLDHSSTHVRRTRAPQRTQMKLTVLSWMKTQGKRAVCVSRGEGRLLPRSRRSRALTTTCRRWRLSSSSTTTSSAFFFCWANAAVAAARRPARLL